MEKTITLNDLHHYLQEINQVEERACEKKAVTAGPSNMTLQNLLRYSSALNVMKTRAAGTIYHLAN